MKIVYCPECGEKMRDESIGWRCPKCKGFVSFIDGKFYPHIERPFVPPMTNADRIRAMSDVELAVFLDGFTCDCIDCRDHDGKNKNCPIYRHGCGRYCEPKDFMAWLQQPFVSTWAALLQQPATPNESVNTGNGEAGRRLNDE